MRRPTKQAKSDPKDAAPSRHVAPPEFDDGDPHLFAPRMARAKVMASWSPFSPSRSRSRSAQPAPRKGARRAQ